MSLSNSGARYSRPSQRINEALRCALQNPGPDQKRRLHSLAAWQLTEHRTQDVQQPARLPCRLPPVTTPHRH